MYKYLVIDTSHNNLLASTNLVGLSELVEIHAPDEVTPRQACGKILRKLRDPGTFAVYSTCENDCTGLVYTVGDHCIFKVVAKNRSGMLRRRHARDEKLIVNMERTPSYKERKIVRAKTGSVRKKK
jgi:hypothetical protein